MPLIIHTGKRENEVMEFVDHDITVLKQMGRFKGLRPTVLRFINPAGEMRIGGFMADWYPGYIVLTPSRNTTFYPCLNVSKRTGRKPKLKMVPFDRYRIKRHLFGLIEVQTGYVIKTEE